MIDYMFTWWGRVLRMVLGAVLAIYALFLLQGIWQIVLIALGLVMVLSGAFNICGLALLFGRDTHGRPRAANVGRGGGRRGLRCSGGC